MKFQIKRAGNFYHVFSLKAGKVVQRFSSEKAAKNFINMVQGVLV